MYDDMDIEPGLIRIRPKGSAEPTRDEIDYLPFADRSFIRIRIESDAPKARKTSTSFWRGSRFGSSRFNRGNEYRREAVACILRSDVNTAMNLFNGKKNKYDVRTIRPNPKPKLRFSRDFIIPESGEGSMLRYGLIDSQRSIFPHAFFRMKLKGLYVTYNEFEAKKLTKIFLFLQGPSTSPSLQEVMLYDIEAEAEIPPIPFGRFVEGFGREYDVLVLSVDSLSKALPRRNIQIPHFGA